MGWYFSQHGKIGASFPTNVPTFRIMDIFGKTNCFLKKRRKKCCLNWRVRHEKTIGNMINRSHAKIEYRAIMAQITRTGEFNDKGFRKLQFMHVRGRHGDDQFQNGG